jgi:hypothetical protein
MSVTYRVVSANGYFNVYEVSGVDVEVFNLVLPTGLTGEQVSDCIMAIVCNPRYGKQVIEKASVENVERDKSEILRKEKPNSVNFGVLEHLLSAVEPKPVEPKPVEPKPEPEPSELGTKPEPELEPSELGAKTES